jgi:universal stress protein E
VNAETAYVLTGLAARGSRRQDSSVPNRILVVVRGSDPQQTAVQRAVLCAAKKTELVLLDVVHEPMLDGYLGNTAIYEPLRARLVAERRERVDALAKMLAVGGRDASAKALWDHPLDEAVAKQAREVRADFVVLAPDAPEHGLSLGEWRVVSTCPAPVLVARRASRAKYARIVAAVDPFHAHAKPVGLDLAILAGARELAMQSGATLSVVHCYTPVEMLGVDAPSPRSADEGVGARRAALEALVEQAGLPKSAARLETGLPAHVALQRLAESGEADLIVLGALARGRLEDWLIGSTAERVLHRGGADVLAVKPAQVR